MMIFSRIVNKVGKFSPNFISRLFAKIPFEFRHGKTYTQFKSKIAESESWKEDELEQYVVTQFDRIFQDAKKFNLYKNKYKEAGVFDLKITSIDDIKKIPILTKSEIREHFSEFKGCHYQQTSGTSGNPLFLCLDINVWAREWAHYHTIWEEANYDYTDAKFLIKRQDLTNKFIMYDFEHNQYVLNTFKMTHDDIDAFFKVMIVHDVKYFHGYPSSIADFLKQIDKVISVEQKELIKKQIECCFFSSEMPLPHVTEYVRKEWGIDFIACYGHSEVCVLAAAKKNTLDYVPFHTYGYVEVEDNALLGTSYHNINMPLIRYNTDDLVREKRYANGIVKSFEVKEGRIFDFIIDKKGLKIAYVGLFLERHHEIWKHIDYFQVFQDIEGSATLLISQNKVDNFDATKYMNLEDFDFDFDYVYLKEPIRTSSGKVPLRVRELP